MVTRLTGAILAASLIVFSGTATAQAPLKIGVLSDMSGVVADVGGAGSVVAAQIAVDEFGGQVLGRKIEIVSADHQFKGDIGLSIARRWFDQENVEAIADLIVSVVSAGVQNLAKERGKIALISGSGTKDLYGSQCSPTGFLWTFDVDMLPKVLVPGIVGAGGKRWFLIGPDYSFGTQMINSTTTEVEKAGGAVVKAVKVPAGSGEFSSALTFALSSDANVLALANAGNDMINAIKQANEFGLKSSGKQLVALLGFITDVHAIGLQSMQGTTIAAPYYWDADEDSRKFAQKFWDKMKRPPTYVQAGVYSSILHYLKAVKAAGSTDGKSVASKMREIPVNDLTVKNGHLRADGRLVRDWYQVQVKSPADSTKPWDYYKIIRKVPAKDAVGDTPSPQCKLPG
jgi:branched-chain amino acid transport system substrate-binding protein